jgi:hypothetical protein
LRCEQAVSPLTINGAGDRERTAHVCEAALGIVSGSFVQLGKSLWVDTRSHHYTCAETKRKQKLTTTYALSSNLLSGVLLHSGAVVTQLES